MSGERERAELVPGAGSGLDLRADCARCFGLCCIAPAFSAGPDFAFDKDAGQACPHLQLDFRCGIHADLRQRGFPGCAVYDCFGAGQKASQVTFGGQDWRRAPDTAERMFEVFRIMRRLHELLWNLTEALALHEARAIHHELRVIRDEIERLTYGGPDAILGVDVAARSRHVNALLLRVASELVRAGAGRRIDRSGADLTGTDLRGIDLHGADLSRVNLRGAHLNGADLKGTDLNGADLAGATMRGALLGGADLRGADLRGADLCGANLGHSILLTQAQLDAATGDAETKVPPSLTRPPHWSSP